MPCCDPPVHCLTVDEQKFPHEQSDYQVYQALSQHVGKMLQSHPRVPLQTLMVGGQCFVGAVGAEVACSMPWCGTEPCSWSGVRTVSGCYPSRDMFHL